MVTKFRVIRLAKAQNDRFLHLFRSDRQPLKIFESKLRFDGSPLFAIYRAGCKELAFHLLGSTEVDETFWARLDVAERITPAQMRVVSTAMERAVGESALRLESQMILLATAVSGAPFLGLLGTVWGVMDVARASIHAHLRGGVVGVPLSHRSSQFQHQRADHPDFSLESCGGDAECRQ